MTASHLVRATATATIAALLLAGCSRDADGETGTETPPTPKRATAAVE